MKVYVVEQRAVDDLCIAVVSSLEQVAIAIQRECRVRGIRPSDVDGLDVQGIVRTTDYECEFWVVGWEIDGSPEEVTVPELNELAKLLGIE